MVRKHRADHASQREANSSITAMIGCWGETLRKWVQQAERDPGQANEILRKASAYFAQAELGRRFKP